MVRITIIGGSGMIGSKLAPKLREKGHEVNIASPSHGVNAVTGEGLADALKGTDIVIDVSDSPVFEPKAIFEHYEKSGNNLVTEEKKAGVKHHLVLSIVGVDLVPLPYYDAKFKLENRIRESGIPYTIVRATQFFEFLERLANTYTSGDTVTLPTGNLQPIAGDDVAEALATYALMTPAANATVNIAGPEKFSIPDIVTRFLSDIKDKRKLVVDPQARWFGTSEKIQDELTPGPDGNIYKINYHSWFSSSKYAHESEERGKECK